MGKLNINEIKKKAVHIVDKDYSFVDGKFLRKLRMDLNMSQSVFASYLGVSKKSIEKWEQGSQKITPPVARLLDLIDKNPNILSCFKEVTIDGSQITFSKNESLSIVECEKDNNDSNEEHQNQKY